MTEEEIPNKPVLTPDDKSKGKEQSKSKEKQPTPLSDENPETKDGQREKQKDKEQHEQDFNAIYKTLHAKFPNIINMDKPVLLAVGIRREILKHLEDDKDITNLVLHKWIKWYFRKSKYYSIHKVGAMRYNLDGTNAGTVTEKDQAKRDKQLRQNKKSGSGQSGNNKKAESTKQDKPVAQGKSQHSGASNDLSNTDAKE